MKVKYDSLNGWSEIVLTFNDGPHPTLTPKILDILKQENIKAMFFVLGINVVSQNNIEIVRRAYKEGHTIGNHTYFHRNMRNLTDFEIKSEIMVTEGFIGEYLTFPKLFRPPYGITDLRINKILKELGYVTVSCNVDTVDWRDESKSWVENAFTQINTRQYSVVQMHDTYESTVEYLPEFIKIVRSNKEHADFINYL
jgi:peptidoglycan/xylan/chitin deacetylase (PgdA/CDA1 family)